MKQNKNLKAPIAYSKGEHASIYYTNTNLSNDEVGNILSKLHYGAEIDDGAGSMMSEAVLFVGQNYSSRTLLQVIRWKTSTYTDYEISIQDINFQTGPRDIKIIFTTLSREATDKLGWRVPFIELNSTFDIDLLISFDTLEIKYQESDREEISKLFNNGEAFKRINPTLDSTFTDIANAIRVKNNSEEKITPSDMLQSIAEISPKNPGILSIYNVNNVFTSPEIMPETITVSNIYIYDEGSYSFISCDNVPIDAYTYVLNLENLTAVSMDEKSVTLTSQSLSEILNQVVALVGDVYTVFQAMNMFGTPIKINQADGTIEFCFPKVKGLQRGYGLALDIGMQVEHTSAARIIKTFQTKDVMIPISMPAEVEDIVRNQKHFIAPGENLD